METMWYGINPRSDKLDLSHEKGKPIAYFLVEEHAIDYGKLWPTTREICKIEKPNHLEHKVLTKNNILIASFKFEHHAINYKEKKMQNQVKLNTK